MKLEKLREKLKECRSLPVCPVCKSPIFFPDAAPLPYCSEKCRIADSEKPKSENFPARLCPVCGREIPPSWRGIRHAGCSAFCLSVLRAWDGYYDNNQCIIGRCRHCGVLIAESGRYLDGKYCCRDCRNAEYARIPWTYPRRNRARITAEDMESMKVEKFMKGGDSDGSGSLYHRVPPVPRAGEEA